MIRLHPAFVHPAFLNPNGPIIAQGPSLRGNSSAENSDAPSVSNARFAPVTFSQGFQAIYSRPFFGFSPSHLTPHQARPVFPALLPQSNATQIVSSDPDKEASGTKTDTGTQTEASQQQATTSTSYATPVVYVRGSIPLSSIQSGINFFTQSLPYYGRIFYQIMNPQGPFYSTTQSIYQNAIMPASSQPQQQPNSFYLPPGSASTPYYPAPQLYPQPYYSSYYPSQPYPQSYQSAPVVMPSGGQVVTAPVTVPQQPVNPVVVKPQPTPTPAAGSSSSSTVTPPATSSGKPFGTYQIPHGATLDDFFKKEPPQNPREKGAFFATVCEEYKQYANQNSLSNCTEDARTFGIFAHDVLGIQQKNAHILSEYLDKPATMPFYANYVALLDTAIQYANANGFAIISFSGHGVNVPANFAAIQDQINPANLANVPLNSYEPSGMVSCQFTLDGKFVSDRLLLSKLMGLNANAFVLIIFDNCHDDFDFPRSITGTGEITNKPALNGLIKGCVTFLGSCKFGETSSDGVPTMEFPAGSGAGTAAYTHALKALTAQNGVDNISFKQLATTAQQQIQGTQTLVVSSSHLFEPDDLVPLTPEGAKAFMEKHSTVTV